MRELAMSPGIGPVNLLKMSTKYLWVYFMNNSEFICQSNLIIIIIYSEIITDMM